MIKRFCDRCEKEAVGCVTINIPYEIEPSRWIDVPTDLCGDCFKELEKFMTEKRSKTHEHDRQGAEGN